MPHTGVIKTPSPAVDRYGSCMEHIMIIESRMHVIIALLALFCIIPARAADPYKVVTAPEVKKMREEGKLIVHTLSRIEYEVQHIPGSINIPFNEISSTNKLPAEKAVPVVFYCAAPECYYSRLASISAAEMGYKNVYWFEGGIAEWRKMQYDMNVNKDMIDIEVPMLAPAEFKALAEKNPRVFILDAQPSLTDLERLHAGNKNPFAKKIKGTSATIPVVELDRKLAKIPKDREILIFDTFMKQAPIAAKYLKFQGFKVVGVLKGGINRWIEEGLPVVNRNLPAKTN